MKYLKSIIVSLLIIFSVPLFADEINSGDDVKKLVANLDRHVDYWFFLNKMAGERYLLTMAVGDYDSKYFKERGEFNSKANTAIKDDYKKLKPHVESNQSTLNILNEFVSSAIADIESLTVGSNETQRSYEARVAAIERELKKKRNILLLQF